MSDNGKGKFIIGAIVGVLAGATLGILFAPRSGKETRKMLGEKAKEYGEKGKELLDKGTVTAKEKIKNVADEISKKMES